MELNLFSRYKRRIIKNKRDDDGSVGCCTRTWIHPDTFEGGWCGPNGIPGREERLKMRCSSMPIRPCMSPRMPGVIASAISAGQHRTQEGVNQPARQVVDAAFDRPARRLRSPRRQAGYSGENCCRTNSGSLTKPKFCSTPSSSRWPKAWQAEAKPVRRGSPWIR